MSLATLIPLLIKISITLTVFAIGLTATFRDATYLFRKPALLLRALLSMNVIMPLFVVLIALSFNLNAPVEIALLALSVSPIPPFLPKKALKSGGAENYTIGLLVASALLSVILIPLTMEFFEAISGKAMQMRARDIAMVVLTSVLLPLVVGISVHVLWPHFAERRAKLIGLIAIVLLGVSCLPILFTSVRAILTLVGDGTLFALAAFAMVGIIVGHLLGGPDPGDRAVLALATSARHPAIAIAIAHVNFPGQKLAGAVVVVYLILSTILTIPYLNWVKRSRAVAVEDRVSPATR
ncbi:MAG TPA: bile acid:sodium symporter [Pyrinomonadaceae bacterium]|nr:bile acid:sodium symporter [Pyrinomonadaceae bacterium]